MKKFWQEWGPYIKGMLIGLPIAAMIAYGFERNPPKWPYYIIVVPAGHTVTVQ